MGIILKALAVLFVLGGLWIWASGKSVTADIAASADATELSASVARIPGLVEGPFDEEGTILFDETQRQNGVAYILYTSYSAQGEPEIRTKRLVFKNQATCAELNLPCATNQPGVPVQADEKVRIIGEVKNEMVTVREVYRL